MKGIKFPGATFDLVKPEGWTDEQCSSLPAARGVTDTNMPYILTAFKPSKEDIEAINRGEPIYLQVLGTTFAPVALYTVDERGNCNPE